MSEIPKKEQRICDECDTIFIPKNKNHLRCSKKCSDSAYKKRELENKSKGLKMCNKCKKRKLRTEFNEGSIICKECTDKNTQENIISTNQSTNKKNKEESPSLGCLDGELKAIEKYKKISEDVCHLMRKNRILKYNTNTQGIILDMMRICLKHLNEELNKKDIIQVEWGVD